MSSDSSADPPRPSLLELDPAACTARVVELGGKPFHAKIVRENVLAKAIVDYERMTALPKDLRARLSSELPVFRGRELARTTASDGTTKLLIGFGREGGADASVETVHMPSLYANLELEPGDTARGATLCVSTQAGCPVRCPFCASGKLGLVRNLAAHEILEQYVRGAVLGPLSRSVVMGMGEPLLNYPNVAAALEVVHDEMGLGARKITLSTVGFPERLRKLAPLRPRFQLAISLHSALQEQRDLLVPAMAGVPVRSIVEAGDEWFRHTGREVTYEYVLLGGENDSARHATALAQLLAGRRATVNLIPFNAVSDSPYRRPDPADVERFRATLESARIVATVRWSRGVESDAACGQLRLRNVGR